MPLLPCSISEARQLQSERERRKEQRSEVNNFISGNPIGELVWVVASYLAASQQWDSLNKRRETRLSIRASPGLEFHKAPQFLSDILEPKWEECKKEVSGWGTGGREKKWMHREQRRGDGGAEMEVSLYFRSQSENSTPASNPLSPQALSHTSCTYKRMKPTQKSEVDFDDCLFPMILFSCRKGSHCGCSVRL